MRLKDEWRITITSTSTAEAVAHEFFLDRSAVLLALQRELWRTSEKRYRRTIQLNFLQVFLLLLFWWWWWWPHHFGRNVEGEKSTGFSNSSVAARKRAVVTVIGGKSFRLSYRQLATTDGSSTVTRLGKECDSRCVCRNFAKHKGTREQSTRAEFWIEKVTHTQEKKRFFYSTLNTINSLYATQITETKNIKESF